MSFAVEEIKVATAGILLVGLAALLTNVLSLLLPGNSGLSFVFWALVLVPIVLLFVGAFAAKAAYYACLGPNPSIALAVIAALTSAVGGSGLWLLASAVAPAPDFVGPALFDRDFASYVDLVPLVIVYALAGAIGGVYDYYISRGRSCEVKPGKGM